MDLKTSQVIACHFVKLAMFRQQQGSTAKNIDRGGNYTIQADFDGKPEAKITRVAAHEEAANGWQQRGTTSTEQNKQLDPGG